VLCNTARTPPKYLWVIERHGRRVRREQPGCILSRTVTLLRPEFQVNGDQVWGTANAARKRAKETPTKAVMISIWFIFLKF
jgi:hypothetical protein